jgi:hypothetical protein
LSSGKRSAAGVGGSGKKLTGRWKRRHDTGPNRQASSDVAPRSPLTAGDDVAREVCHGAAFPASPHWPTTANGHSRTTLPVRALPHRRSYLQPLRSWQPLLHIHLRRAGPSMRHSCRRPPLSGQSLRPSRPRGTPASLPRPAAESDASGFPRPHPD